VAKATKYIFVTGGVLSGLGKGITAASIANLLKARGLRVNLQKCDPYLNVDAGTEATDGMRLRHWIPFNAGSIDQLPPAPEITKAVRQMAAERFSKYPAS